LLRRRSAPGCAHQLAEFLELLDEPLLVGLAPLLAVLERPLQLRQLILARGELEEVVV